VKLKIEDVPKKRDALADSIEKDIAKLGEFVHTVRVLLFALSSSPGRTDCAMLT
jgi:hypothetical protein